MGKKLAINKQNLTRLAGIVGTVAFIVYFARNPSWPTGDKIIVFLTFLFMALGQAREMLKRLLPFVGLLLVYDSMRGLAPVLNKHVHYLWMVNADQRLFGSLPTATLQNWLWHGHVMWYDFVFYGFYMMHFVLPLVLAIAVWKLRESHYWQVVTTYVVLSFMGFFTFLAFPAAPPWLASDAGFINPIAHVSNYVFAAIGFHNFPSVYDKIAPNAVAAVPSLHAAYGTLLVIFTYKLFGKKWALLAAIYPLVIYVGTVYSGEHYAIDEIIGIAYAFAAYFGIKWLFAHEPLRRRFDKIFHTKKQRRKTA